MYNTTNVHNYRVAVNRSGVMCYTTVTISVRIISIECRMSLRVFKEFIEFYRVVKFLKTFGYSILRRSGKQATDTVLKGIVWYVRYSRVRVYLCVTV